MTVCRKIKVIFLKFQQSATAIELQVFPFNSVKLISSQSHLVGIERMTLGILLFVFQIVVIFFSLMTCQKYSITSSVQS